MIGAFKKIFNGGISRPHEKLSRNDQCWCGSGCKYKRCHMEKDMAADRIKADASRR